MAQVRQPATLVYLSKAWFGAADDGQIDNYGGPELGELIKKHNIRNPATGSELTPPVEFNLMFQSDIGPTGQIKG